MQVSVETGDGLTRRMKVELPAEEIEQEVEKRLQNHARSANLPGFRPGKVPLRMLRQRYGHSVRMEVFSERVEASFPQAIAEVELQPSVAPTSNLSWIKRRGVTPTWLHSKSCPR